MDVASANDYMEYLQSLDPDKYQDYINKWNELSIALSKNEDITRILNDISELKIHYPYVKSVIYQEQITGRWSYNRRPAVFGVYIIYEYGKNLEDVWVYINQNIF